MTFIEMTQGFLSPVFHGDIVHTQKTPSTSAGRRRHVLTAFTCYKHPIMMPQDSKTETPPNVAKSSA